jgi:hypothetical protein
MFAIVTAEPPEPKEGAMLKLTLICAAYVASIFAGSFVATGAEYDPEDESRAFVSRPSRAEYGTPAEAMAMLRRAVAAIKSGKVEAIASFNHNDQPFRDRDLFVFCFTELDGKYTAHEAMVGHDVRTFVDGNGRNTGWQMYQTAMANRIVEIDFVSPLPGTTDLVPKHAYVTRVGDQVCGVSAYRVD